MSLRESHETLLPLQDIQEGPKPPSYPGDNHMPLDVLILIWNTGNYNKEIPLYPVRFSLNKNLTVAEAGRLAFQKYLGNVPEEMHMFIGKSSYTSYSSYIAGLSAIGDENEEIKNLFQEREVLIVSDVPNYHQRKLDRGLYVMCGVLFGSLGILLIFLMIVSSL